MQLSDGLPSMPLYESVDGPESSSLADWVVADR